MRGTFPPLHEIPVKGRAWLVAGVLAGTGSPEGLVDLVFDADVDLQTAEDIGLMDREIFQERLCVQRLSPGLGVEDPVRQESLYGRRTFESW